MNKNFSAVLVGINKYKHGPLNGCINDVVIMRDILVKKYKVPASQIRLITDNRATKANIEERLEWLVTNDAENKMFHYSGHGAQIPVQDYKEFGNEVDKMDEIICPFDFNWDGNYITDNTVNDILSKMLDDKHITMVFDSCHSGTMDRGSAGNPYIKEKRMVMPIDLMSRDSDISLSTELGLTNSDIGVTFPGPDKIITKGPAKISKHNVSIITGCREDQTSADAYFRNRYQGALSYVFQSVIMKKPNISLKDLKAECTKLLGRYGFSQKPQIICNQDNLHKPFIQV